MIARYENDIDNCQGKLRITLEIWRGGFQS